MTPRQLRQKLGLNKTQAGRVILGIKDPSKANATWGKIERDSDAGKPQSNALRELLKLWECYGDLFTTER